MKKLIAILASLGLLVTSCGNNGNLQSGNQNDNQRVSQKGNSNSQKGHSSSQVNTTSRAS